VLVQYRSRSLNRHIRDGWQIMFNPAVGEFLETLPPQYHSGDSYLGTADAVYQNLFAVREEEPEAIVILAGDHIYKMDYRLLVNYHVEKGADATVAAGRGPAQGGGRASSASSRSTPRTASSASRRSRRIPKPLPSNPTSAWARWASTSSRPSVLYKLLEDDARDPKSSHDFGKNIIPKMVGAIRSTPSASSTRTRRRRSTGATWERSRPTTRRTSTWCR
jgi:glucose-1-phosphate adenylyltransferase